MREGIHIGLMSDFDFQRGMHLFLQTCCRSLEIHHFLYAACDSFFHQFLHSTHFDDLSRNATQLSLLLIDLSPDLLHLAKHIIRAAIQLLHQMFRLLLKIIVLQKNADTTANTQRSIESWFLDAHV